MDEIGDAVHFPKSVNLDDIAVIDSILPPGPREESAHDEQDSN